MTGRRFPRAAPLNFAAHAAGGRGREALLRESTDLRRELGFDAGVAANLIGHAYLAAELGRDDVEGTSTRRERLDERRRRRCARVDQRGPDDLSP